MPRAYRTNQGIEYGYGCCTELTKGSGTGVDAVPSLPKGRVRVWMSYQAYQSVGYGWYGCLYPYPYPIPCILTRPYLESGYFAAPGYFAAGVPNLPKYRVRVWMSYRTYQRVGYGYGCFAKLTKGSGMVRLLVPVPVPDPGYFNRAVPGTRVLPLAYRTYQSIGYGYGSCTKLTKVSGTGNTRSTYHWYTLVGTLPYTP